jgi:hypothetical protein
MLAPRTDERLLIFLPKNRRGLFEYCLVNLEVGLRDQLPVLSL